MSWFPCLIGMNDVVGAGGDLGCVPVGRLTDVPVADSAVDQPRAELADGGGGGSGWRSITAVRPLGRVLPFQIPATPGPRELVGVPLTRPDLRPALRELPPSDPFNRLRGSVSPGRPGSRRPSASTDPPGQRAPGPACRPCRGGQRRRRSRTRSWSRVAPGVFG